MTDEHLRSDAMGTLYGVRPILRWLRESLPGENEEAVETPLVAPLRLLLERLGGNGSTGGDLESMLGELKVRIPPLAATVRDMADHEVQELLDDVEAHLRAVGSAVSELAVPHGSGRVDGLYVSNGGVPKLPVDRAEVDRRGLTDDRQAARRHHGKPMQALCLYSTEVIDALRAEGHPINPGSAGENITISGLEWPALRPFLRLRIGEVVAELSSPATPCAKNERWFADGDSSRIDHDLHPGWSRWYAWVLSGGTVSVGDPVRIELDRKARVDGHI